MTVQRGEYTALILERLHQARDDLRAQFARPGRVRSFVLDDLLPEPMAREIFEAFPSPREMAKRHSLKESKYFSAQLDRHSPIVEEITFALQDPSVVAAFAELTGIEDLLPDPQLYAGGISVMVKGGFLNPHLDNSHDGEQKRYRVLNSLYYLTPGWREEYGGNLELWDEGPTGRPRTLASRFNRLVMMETTRASWHSVSPITFDGRRTCVSNYYFREKALEKTDYFHATSFRGRPGQAALDLLLRADNALRTGILSVVNVPTRHIYKK